MKRYAMSQGKPYTQRATACLAEKDVHRRVFAHSMDPEVESAVRKRLYQRLDGFYCDLQPMYTPHYSSATGAGTHIVLNNAPPLPSMARNDEAVEVDARGLNARDAVKAPVKATGSSPHPSVCGWPFCLGDPDDMEGGAV